MPNEPNSTGMEDPPDGITLERTRTHRARAGGVTIAPTLTSLRDGEPDLANARSRTRIEAAVLELLDDAA